MKKIIIICTALFVTVLAQSQELKPWSFNLPVGKTFKTETKLESLIKQEIGGQEMETPSKITTWDEVSVLSGNASEGFKVSKKISRMLISASAMGQEMNFDTDKKEDWEGEIGSLMPMKNKMGKNYTANITSSGEIIVDQVEEKEDEPSDNPMAAMFKQFDFTANKDFFKSILLESPKNNISIGSSWSKNEVKDKDSVNTIYTFKSMNGNIATIDYSNTSNVNSEMEMNGQTIKRNMVVKTTGTITVDITTGIIVEKTSNTSSEGTVEAQGMEIKISGNTTTKSTVTQL